VSLDKAYLETPHDHVFFFLKLQTFYLAPFITTRLVLGCLFLLRSLNFPFKGISLNFIGPPSLYSFAHFLASFGLLANQYLFCLADLKGITF